MIYIGPGLTLVMWLLYIVGIQYRRGGVWRVVLPVTIAALLLDVALNYTLFALLTLDFPQPGEYTFSQRLGRLVCGADWRSALARWVAKYMLDWADPSGQHIHPRCKA